MNTADDPAPDVLARTLEEAGFESLWYGEHSHIPASRKTPYPAGGELPAPYRKMMDPYVSLMAAAAVTSRLKLGTGIALLMERELFSQAKTIATLDRAFARGAVAVKIWKEVGIDIKNRDGKFILPDDPLFDPIYEHLAKIGKPLHAHLAEPIDAWLPLDKDSSHYSYYSTNPQWHLYGKPEYPSHAAIIAARDNVMKKHPTLVVVGAHLDSVNAGPGRPRAARRSSSGTSSQTAMSSVATARQACGPSMPRM